MIVRVPGGRLRVRELQLSEGLMGAGGSTSMLTHPHGGQFSASKLFSLHRVD